MKTMFVKKSMWWLLAIGFIVVLLASTWCLLPYANKQKTTTVPIQFGGTYQLNENAAPQPLTGKTYIDACKEKSVLLRGAFGYELKKDTQIFCFMEYLEVHIYLNGDEIYAWGTKETHPDFMRSSGAAWGHFVLPAAVSPSDEVTILLESKYSNNYNLAYHDFLDSLQVGDSGALARSILTENWPYLFTGLLLFLVGISLLLFVLLLVRQGVPIHSSVYFCVVFSLSASLWMVMNPVYSTLVFANAPLVMLLETVSMWLVTTFMFGYFGTFMQTKARRANNILLFGFVFTLPVFLILQLFGVTDAYAVRDIHNVLVCVAFAAFLFILRYEVCHAKKTALCTFALPGMLYVIFGAVEVLNYEFEWLQRGAALAVGFSIFILAQFVFAVWQIRKSLVMSKKAISMEKELVESRTAVMLSQIQPHFLYNSLNGIKTLCGSDPEKAEVAMEHFAYFLRSNLDSLSDTRLTTFDKEIGHIKDYFYLEKMRFKERVCLVLELQDRDFLLPPLTLQPLVENAVRYGIMKKDCGGSVTVKSQRQGNCVVILITDDGVGFDVNASKGGGRSHIGIENVRARLALQCGGSLEIRSEIGVGTEVQITLPEKEEEQ